MVKKIYILTLLFILLSGCSENYTGNEPVERSIRESTSVYPDNTGLSGNWIMVAFEDLESGFRTVKDSENSWGGLDVVIRISGNTFCGTNTTNAVAGLITVNGTTLKVESYGGSKVGQPHWGNLFSNNIFSVESYLVKNNYLRLYCNQNRNAIVLQKLHRDIGCELTFQGT